MESCGVKFEYRLKNDGKTQVIDFCKSELLSGRDDEEILRLLAGFAEEVETVRKNYRNPSAHTNMLQ